MQALLLAEGSEGSQAVAPPHVSYNLQVREGEREAKEGSETERQREGINK